MADNTKWKGRNLQNYKMVHKGTATEKDVLKAFMAAPTLTKARKILFGEKLKRCVARRDNGPCVHGRKATEGCRCFGT